jgi:threonine dehydrogenase-like Zn-dependent dehydrogenase
VPARWAVAANGVDGGQGEAVRVPQAQGTLVKLPVGEDSALLPSLLTLSDVFPTGHHCAVTAGVGSRTTVTVIGDGAVGLSAVLAAKRLGAERIILMGRHIDRTDRGLEFGTTDVVAECGPEGVETVRELTGGDGTVEPGRVFDRTVSLDEVPGGYRSMADREALRSSSGPDPHHLNASHVHPEPWVR